MTIAQSGPICDFCGNHLLRSMMGMGEDEGEFRLNLIPDRTLHFCKDCKPHVEELAEFIEDEDPSQLEIVESGIHENWPDGVMRRAFEDAQEAPA